MTACAVVTASAYVAAGVVDMAGLTAPVDPPAWPAVPLVLVVATVISALPAWIAPPIPLPRIATSPLRVREEVAA